MVDAGGEVDLRGLERVVGREGDAQEEHAGGVGAVGLHIATRQYAYRCDHPREVGHRVELFERRRYGNVQGP